MTKKKQASAEVLADLVRRIEETGGVRPDELLQELEATAGLTIKDRGSTTELKLAGLTATCTYGAAGALSNWAENARRHLMRADG